MAITISVGIQKGGCGKTLTSGIIAYLLSKRGYRVLAVDMDSQGNLTQLLTEVEDIYVFRGRTMMDAVKKGLSEDHIIVVDDNLHIIPSTDILALYPSYIATAKAQNKNNFDYNMTIGFILAPVQDRYDFIIIDTPPALSEQTLNSLAASDYILTMFEASNFCLAAIPRFFETYVHLKDKVNPNVKMLGVVRTLIDIRRVDNNLLVKTIDEMIEGVCFETVINRTAAVGRIGLKGFKENEEIKKALEQHEKLLDEILGRIIENDDYFKKIDEVIEEYLVKDFERLEELEEKLKIEGVIVGD